MRLRMKQTSSAPTRVDYDDRIFRIQELEKRKEVLQNSRSLGDEADELRMLVKLFADLTPYEAHCGPSLLRDDLFAGFVRQLVVSVTGHEWLDKWPYSYLDWERVIAHVRAEYVEISFNGHAYWLDVGSRRFVHQGS